MRRGVLRGIPFMGGLFVGGLALFVSQVSCAMAWEVVSDAFLAKMSQDAYQPHFGKGKKVFSVGGVLGREPVAFFFQHRGQELLVFRGSRSGADWLVNLDAALAPCQFLPAASGKVHQGFCRRAEQLSLYIFKELRARQGALYLTGHSQGGALASLVALMIRVQYPEKKLHLVTFGAPSLGGETFSRYLEKSIPENHRHYMIITDLVSVAPMMGGVLKRFSRTFLELEDEDEEEEFSLNPNIVWLPLNVEYDKGRGGELSGVVQHGIQHYVSVLQWFSSACIF